MVATSPARKTSRFARYPLAFLISMLLWLLLTGSLAADELAAGVLVSLAVTLLCAPRLEILDGLRLNIGMLWHLPAYLVVFTVALVRANLDMARRVLSPSLPIRPGMVRIRTGLTSTMGKLLLANSITLTPGTLSVDVRDDLILVHWIDSPPDVDTERATRQIAASFERHLSGFLS